jgi:hypothetical protein
MERTDRRQGERRRDLRYPFTAAVEAVEPKSQTKLNARTSDISLGRCYVDTINPFLEDAELNLSDSFRVLLAQPKLELEQLAARIEEMDRFSCGDRANSGD